MITETGKFFSVPCERPQRWSPPFWKRQLPQTKLLGITHTRLYNDVSSGNFQAKGLSCYHRGLTILFNLTKMGLSDKVFSIQNNNNKKKTPILATTMEDMHWLFQWQRSDMTDSSNHFSPGYAIERIPKFQ